MTWRVCTKSSIPGVGFWGTIILKPGCQTPTMQEAALVVSQSGHAARPGAARPLQVLFADRKWHGEDGWLLFRAANPRMQQRLQRCRACQGMCMAEGAKTTAADFANVLG